MIVKIVGKTVDTYQYGTGVFINKNIIVTCYHTIKQSNSIHIMYGNSLYPSSIFKYNDKCDICLLKTNTNNSQFYKLANPKDSFGSLRIQSYWADNTFIMTHQTNVLASHYKTHFFPTALLIDIKSYKGMSGAPILNEKNEIVTLLMWNTDIGTGCLHPEIFHNMLSKGVYDSGELSISTNIISILDTLNNQHYDYTFGEKVIYSTEKSIQPGDIISHANGIPLNSYNLDIKSMCFCNPPNYSLKLMVHKKRLKYKKCIKVEILT